MPFDIVLANIASGICGCVAGDALGRLLRPFGSPQKPARVQEDRAEPEQDNAQPETLAQVRHEAIGVQTDLPLCEAVVPSAPLRADESARLQRLCELQALGLESGRLLDDITAILGWLCDMPVVLVSLVTAKKLCFMSRFGLDGRQAPREEHSLCAWCISPTDPEVLVVDDASKDGRTCRSGIVAGPPHVRFYAGCPLQTTDGFPLGTLCLIDQVPRHISSSVSQLLVNFAEIVSRNLEKFDLESVELPSQRVPAEDIDEEPQPPPTREHFRRGPLRLDRVLKSFGDAHLLVLASPHTTRWPVLWADCKWQKLTNGSVLPPSKPGESASVEGRVHFWDTATWIDDCGLDEQRGGVRRPDAFLSEQIRHGAVMRLPVLLKSLSQPQGIEAVARCVPAGLPLDTNAAAIGLEAHRREESEEGLEGFHIEEGYSLYFFVIRPCQEPIKRKLQAVSELSVREASSALLKDVELKQLVGAGSFGKVYLGDWIGAQVAVKVLHRVPNTNQPGSAFEACLSSALWHPNIVQTFEHCTREIVKEPDETVARLLGFTKDKMSESLRMYETMIVQDWCDGGTLSRLVEDRHPMGPAGGGVQELVDDVSDIASALAYMHDRDIVHGDLSANNVLLASRPTSRGYVCKVCDFGLARAVGGEAASLRKLADMQAPCGESNGAGLPTLLGGQLRQMDEKIIDASKPIAKIDIGRTDAAFARGASTASEPEAEPLADKERQRAAVISTQSLGTVQYMPPEMLSITSEPALSAKVDIYSLGIIAWQLATGKVPWEGLSPPQVVIRINRGKRLTLTDAPADIIELVDMCTAKLPDDRPDARRLVRAWRS